MGKYFDNTPFFVYLCIVKTDNIMQKGELIGRNVQIHKLDNHCQ